MGMAPWPTAGDRRMGYHKRMNSIRADVQADLEILNGDLAGESFPLGDELLVGRCEGDAPVAGKLCLPDARVSREHACIVRRDGAYFVQDLGSTNGSLLNARVLTPQAFYPLHEGCNLQFGGVHLRFRPNLSRPAKADAAWGSALGEHEEAFDLALIAGGDAEGPAAGEASMQIVGSASARPNISMAVDAVEALKALRSHIADGEMTAKGAQGRLRALAKISIDLGGHRDRESLLTKVMDLIFDIFPTADHAYGLLCRASDDGRERLKPVVSLSRQKGRVAVAISRAIISEVISKRQAVLSSDARADRRFDSHQSIIGLGIRSVMCVPLLVEDEVLGLIQVDTGSTHDFDQDDLQVLTGIGAQAAIGLKNLGLVEDIQQLFEGFVSASVHAIEARDPSTAGHSFRVAEYSQGLAAAVDRSTLPALRDVSFSREQLHELRYAALLHDFGKVGVREHVLTKAHKLYPRQLDLLQARFRFARASLERAAYRDLLDELEREPLGPAALRERRRKIEQMLQEEQRKMRDFMAMIMQANQPAVERVSVPDNLDAVRDFRFPGDDGEPMALLSDFELDALTLARGSLTPDERQEIESHVVHTYAFLKHIPWTKGLAAVPEIAYTHHEKLDGSGYPRGIVGEEIPLQARIMTVTDIYDALTAGDRPYKQSLSEEVALDILRQEARAGRIESHLVDIFIDSGVYRQTRVTER